MDKTKHLANQLSWVGKCNISAFYQNDAYGRTRLDGAVHAVKKRSMILMENATVERNSQNVNLAAKRQLTKRPDAILEISTYSVSAAMRKQMRTSGYTGPSHNVAFVASQLLASALDAGGQGIGVSQVVPFLLKLSNPVVDEYGRALKNAGTGKTNFSSLEVDIAAKVFAEYLRRTGPDLRRARCIAALKTNALKNYETGFPMGFPPTRHPDLAVADMTVITKNEKFLN